MCERVEPAHLIVLSRTQHLAVLRVHQMRLSARKARYLGVREVIVFGVISPPQHTGARRGVPSSAGSCVPAIGYP
jgi:hypothetical protein